MSRTFLVIVLALGIQVLGPRDRVEAQIEVTASVDEKTVGLNDVARFTISISGVPFSQVTNPSPPDAEGLTLLQRTASTQQNISFVNSAVQQSISFTWQYRPQRVGDARIDAARVTVGNRQFTTEAIAIKVVPAGQRNSAGARPPGVSNSAGLAKEDVFIRAEASKQTVYQNEQLILEYVLYFRHGVLLRNSRLADSWDTGGFWREDLDVKQQSTMRTEIVNGLRYNTVVLKRVAIFPTRSGELMVEPLRVESEVALPRRSTAFRSFLFDRAARFQSTTVESPPVNIIATALPSPPPDFRGVVGDLRIQTSVNRREVEAGEPIQFTVVLSGRGNIATLPEPPLELPPLIEKFGPEISDSIDRSGRSVSGTKTFVYTLVPRSGGRHTIPGFSIPYFDPDRGEYRRLESEPVAINVSGAVIPAASTVPTSRFPIDDIAPPHDEAPTWVNVDRDPLHRHEWPYVVLVVPLIGLASLFLYRKRLDRIATDERFARSRRAHPAARKHLIQAEVLLSQGRSHELYAEITGAVLGYVGDRLHLAPQGMTQEQLRVALEGKGLSPSLSNATIEILGECETAQFSPAPPDAQMMQDVVERAATLIAGIHEEVKRKGLAA